MSTEITIDESTTVVQIDGSTTTSSGETIVTISNDQGPQGPQGFKGDTGTSITNVQRTSGTGAPGTTDTYTITFSDATTTTFPVYNGSNGRAISSIAKTSTVGLIDTYTVTYSDATTSTFTVTNGAKGDTGDFDGYGFGWTFSSNTNMGTAPSNGTFKINNTNSASASQIAISKVNSEGGAVNISWFTDLAGSNNRIIIREKTLPGTYIVYAIVVSGVYDNGTYVVMNISHITRNGSITNGDSCWIVAMVGGQDGATGPAGPGLATAGNTGDLLIKTGSADYQTGWTTPSNTPTNGVIPLYASSSYGSAGLRVGQGGIGIAGQGSGIVQTIIAAGGYGTAQLPTGSNLVLAATTDRTAGITGNQAINTVYAAPSSGSAGLANFRSLVANDIPTLSPSKITGVTIAPWAASTNYLRGDLVSYWGNVYRRISDGTSGATFDPTMWQQQSTNADLFYTNYNDVTHGAVLGNVACPMFNLTNGALLEANSNYEIDLVWHYTYTVNSTTAYTNRVNFSYTGTLDSTNPITFYVRNLRDASTNPGTTGLSTFEIVSYTTGGSIGVVIGQTNNVNTSYTARLFCKAIVRTSTSGRINFNQIFGTAGGSSPATGVTAFSTKSGSFMRIKYAGANTGANYVQGDWS